MKYTFWGAGFILFGMAGVVFIAMFQNLTLNDESEYYTLREAVEASMYEAVDIAYYRETGEVKIIKEKFVANCTRRFLASINGSGEGYQLTYFDIIEKPPKVSVVATSKTGAYSIVGNTDGFDVLNGLTGILEFDDPIGEGKYVSSKSSKCNNKTIVNVPNKEYGELCVPGERDNETFRAWYTAPNCGGTKVDFNTKMSYNLTQNLYECWDKKKYTITFDSAEGTGSDSKVCNYGESCTLIGGTGFTRTNYVFDGWKDKNGNKVSGPVTYNKDVTLYATWREKVIITFDANGGSGAPSSIECTSGQNCNLPTATPSKTGYNFDGWSETKNGNKVTSPVRYTSSKTLYARWNANTYTVKFDGNGKTGGSTSNITCTYDSNCTLPSSGFTKTNYVFDGWSKTINGTKLANTVKNLTSTKNGTYILYARWVKQFSLSLSGDTNIDTVGGAGNYKEGDTVYINATPKKYYHFTKWTKISGDSPANADSVTTSVKMTQNTSLKANSAPNVINLHYCWPNNARVAKTRLYGSAVNLLSSSNSNYVEAAPISGYSCHKKRNDSDDKAPKSFTYGIYTKYKIRNANGSGGSYEFRDKDNNAATRYWTTNPSNTTYVIDASDESVSNWSDFESKFINKLTVDQKKAFEGNSIKPVDVYLYPVFSTSGVSAYLT